MRPILPQQSQPLPSASKSQQPKQATLPQQQQQQQQHRSSTSSKAKLAPMLTVVTTTGDNDVAVGTAATAISSRENLITPRFSNRSSDETRHHRSFRGSSSNNNNNHHLGFDDWPEQDQQHQRQDGEDDDNGEHNDGGECCKEVDAFVNPTELFQWLNYGNYDGAMQHIQQHPEEAKIWIVSRGGGGGVPSPKSMTTTTTTTATTPKGQQQQQLLNGIKWRYLPLHLVCLKPDIPDDLLRAIVMAYPKAARKKDHAGNLPIHYWVAEQHQQQQQSSHAINTNGMRILLEAFPESVHRKDRKGRSLTEIVSEQYNKGLLEKDVMLTLLSTIRQWKMGTSFDNEQQQQQPQSFALDGAVPTPSAAAAAAVVPASDDRDRFIETAAVVTLTNQLTSTARELNTEKEKARRKSEKIHVLRANIKGNGERIKGLIQKLEAYEEERETIANVSLENRALKMKLEAMERELDESEKRFQSKQKVQARGQAVEAKLKSRIAMLEKELLELRTEKMQEEITKRICGDPKRVEEERDVLREMNESLQEHLNALKERCKDLEQDEEEKGELRSKLESANMECADLNRKLSAALEEAEATKSESFIAQSRLQTKIATLEKDLLEATAMLEAQAQAMDKPFTDLKILEDDRNAMQQVNQSLQEHVVALNEKCRILEKSLQETKEQAAAEKVKDQTAVSERQRELQLEFRSISSYLQNLTQLDPSKRGDAATEYLRQVEQLRDVVGGSGNNNNNNNNNNSVSGEVQRLIENLKRDRSKLITENEELRNQVRKILESRDENEHSMATELQRIAHKAEDYRQQLIDLKGKFEKLKSNNMGLRDVIAKNNAKYITKVESLGKEFKALQKANAALKEQLHEVTLENRRLRETSMVGQRSIGHSDHKNGEFSSRHHQQHVPQQNRHEETESVHIGASREQLLKMLANRDKGHQQPHQQPQQQQHSLQAELRINPSLKIVPLRDTTPLRQSKPELLAQEDRDDILDEVTALLGTATLATESRDVHSGGGLHRTGSEFQSVLAEHPNLRS